MTNEELVKEWILAEELEKRDDKLNHWSVDHVLEFVLDERYDDLWEFVICACEKELSEKVISILAAGPLEDLLAHAGDEYISKVEARAKTDRKFNHLLGGVWQNTMSDELWQRVCAARDTEW